MRNFIFVKDIYKDSLVCVALGFTLELPDRLALAAARMMTMDNANKLEQMVAYVCFGVATTGTAKDYMELTDEQHIELEYLNKSRKEIVSIYKATIPTSTNYSDEKGMYIAYYTEAIVEHPTCLQVGELIQEMLPPPLSVWASGGLVGYDIPPDMLDAIVKEKSDTTDSLTESSQDGLE